MARGTYTVSTDPIRGREYTNKHNTDLTVWRLGLENAQSAAPDGLFELHKVKAPPNKGEQIEVDKTIEGEFDGEKFVRLFLVDTYQKDQKGSGQSSGAARNEGPGLAWQNKPYNSSAEHPRNESRMIHTSALSATPGYLNSALAFGAIDGETLQPTERWDDYWKLVGQVATKLTRSYERAMDDQQSLPVNGQGEAPADTQGLESQPAPSQADAEIPF